jgi:hypothetical protein
MTKTKVEVKEAPPTAADRFLALGRRSQEIELTTGEMKGTPVLVSVLGGDGNDIYQAELLKLRRAVPEEIDISLDVRKLFKIIVLETIKLKDANDEWQPIGLDVVNAIYAGEGPTWVEICNSINAFNGWLILPWSLADEHTGNPKYLPNAKKEVPEEPAVTFPVDEPASPAGDGGESL